MKKIGIFMADGCEEIEGLTVVDVVRRAGIAIDMISITGKKEVAGAHGITFAADVLAEEADFDSYDGIVLPGGMPGTINLGKHEIVKKVITSYAAGGKLTWSQGRSRKSCSRWQHRYQPGHGNSH